MNYEVEEPLTYPAICEGMPILYFTPTSKEAGNCWKGINEKYGEFIDTKNAQERKIYFEGGGHIYFYSLPNHGKKDEGRGEKGIRVIYDEFQKIPDDVARHHFQEVVIPLLADYPESEVWIFGTANGQGSYFHELACKGAKNAGLEDEDIQGNHHSDNTVTYRASTDKNPNIDEDSIKLLKGEVPPKIALQEFDAIFLDLNQDAWCYEFQRSKHVTNERFEINPNFPLWHSFDFNVNPTTCTIGQLIPGFGLYIHRVYQVNGGTRKLCALLKKYNSILLRNVTGDRSGSSEHTALEVLDNGALNVDYGIIEEELNISQYNFFGTLSANKQHKWSRDIVNTVFYRIPVFINKEYCQALIDDLAKAMPTKDGKLFKERAKGHDMDALDSFRYLIHQLFPNGYDDINLFAHQLIAA